MDTRRLEAIVIGMTDCRDADRVVRLLTAEEGMMTTYARGSRKSFKRFGGSLAPFSVIEAMVRAGRGGMPSLVGVDGGPIHVDLSTNLDAFAAASVLAEVVTTLVPEGHAEPMVYQLLVDTLADLSEAEEHEVAHLFVVSSLALLMHTGFLPSLDRCTRCGTSVGLGARRFGLTEQGLVCDLCHRLPGSGLSEALLAIILHHGRGDEDTHRAAHAGPLEARYLMERMGSIIGRPIRSRAFYEELLRDGG